jgi:hypothetical protein
MPQIVYEYENFWEEILNHLIAIINGDHFVVLNISSVENLSKSMTGGGGQNSSKFS